MENNFTSKLEQSEYLLSPMCSQRAKEFLQIDRTVFRLIITIPRLVSLFSIPATSYNHCLVYELNIERVRIFPSAIQ